MRFTVYERAEYYERTENGLFPIGCRDFRGKGGYAKTERLRLEYFYARAEAEYFFRKHVVDGKHRFGIADTLYT